MEHFGAAFQLELTEETRTQLQQEEAIASSCLILATPMVSILFVCVCVRVIHQIAPKQFWLATDQMN